MPRCRLLLRLALLFATACPAPLSLLADGGLPDGGLPDGGLRAVSGRSASVHLTGATAPGAPVPEDLSRTEISAWVAEADGGASRYPGTGTAEGTWEVPGVPAGPYLLQVGRTYLVTSAREVDFTDLQEGRADALTPSEGTSLKLNATGLSPWQFTDDLQLFSAGAGLSFWSYLSYGALAGDPNDADTSLNGFEVEANKAAGFRLVDRNKGDALTAVHLATQPTDGGVRVISAVSAFTSTGLAMVDRQSNALSGAFAPLPQRATNLDLRLQELAFEARKLHPAATEAGTSVFVSSLPASGTADIFRGSAPDLLIAVYEPKLANTVLRESYGDPYGAGRERVGVIQAEALVTHAFPTPDGGTVTRTSVGGVSVEDRLSNLERGPIVPLVGPPTVPRVDARPLQSDLAGVGLTPELSWASPATGSATHFRVMVTEFVPNPDPARAPSLVTLGTLWTRGYKLRLPPGLLRQGGTFRLSLTAIHSPGMDIERAPWRYRWPYATGMVVSGKVTP